MKKDIYNVSSLITLLLKTGAKKATKYLSDKQIVRATRRVHDGEFSKKKTEILITIGTPNYREREFIKACKKAKESFPIKKVQLSFIAKKKK